MGICREDGIILDFGIASNVNINRLAFGSTAKYVRLHPYQVNCYYYYYFLFLLFLFLLQLLNKNVLAVATYTILNISLWNVTPWQQLESVKISIRVRNASPTLLHQATKQANTMGFYFSFFNGVETDLLILLCGYLNLVGWDDFFAVLFPRSFVNSLLQGCIMSHGTRDIHVMGRCIEQDNSALLQIVQLLQLQLPLICCALHEPDGISRLTKVEPHWCYAHCSLQGTVCQHQWVHTCVSSICCGDDFWSCNGWLDVLLRMGNVHISSCGLVHLWYIRFQGHHRLLACWV